MTVLRTVAASACGTALLYVGACAAGDRPLAGGPEPARIGRTEQGPALFARHCATCHGIEGRADGPASGLCFPPPRDFGEGRFLLVSGLDQGPSRSDLVQTLAGGMPGSAMPAFGWLPMEELTRLADHVLKLTQRAVAEDLVLRAELAGRDLPWTRAVADASARLAAGQLAKAPPPSSPPDPVLGAAVYEANCAACHGLDGRGRGDEPRVLPSGELAWARDFTAGILKGGASREALAARIQCGMPAGGMPALSLPKQELAALLDHVEELIPLGQASRHRMRRGRIRAPRVSELPVRPDDPRWSRGLAVALTPLDWRSDAVFEVQLAAFHDGSRLAVRLRWEDATRDDQLLGGGRWPDAAGLMFSRSFDPPLDGMGASDNPVHVWHWRAAAWEDVSGALDLVPGHSGLVPPGEGVDVPVLRRAVDAERAEAFIARGAGTLRNERRRSSPLVAQGRHADGLWEVVFIHPLDPDGDPDLRFDTGLSISMAPAVWNGSAGDHGARKSFGLWQTLVLEP